MVEREQLSDQILWKVFEGGIEVDEEVGIVREEELAEASSRVCCRDLAVCFAPLIAERVCLLLFLSAFSAGGVRRGLVPGIRQEHVLLQEEKITKKLRRKHFAFFYF